MAYDIKIEEKWRKRWDEAKLFESDPEDKAKFYINVAYPYPSGGMHVGHARTYTVPDIFARYKRMRGYNVLFPMAWHVTGTPIIGALNRMKEGEEKQCKILKEVYGLTQKDMDGIKTPMDFARYFIENHYIQGMRGLGYSIDWRRQFTTNDLHYNKFITWQYLRLHDEGLLKEGKHPVKYCIEEKNPVTAHDLLEGDDAEMQEWTLLKFRFKDSYLVAATLRPETVFGQTNMWVNPEVEYVRAKVKKGEKSEIWIISADCARKLPYQDFEVDVIAKIPGASLLGEYCTAPGINREIIILPSSFPDPKVATGLVTSVPSDAPYDFMALQELKKDAEMSKKYKLDGIKIIPIIRTKKFGENAALKVTQQMKIRSLVDSAKLDEATKEVYKEGFHTGVMNDACGEYANMPVEKAKELIKQELIDKGLADTMHEFSEPMRCRCGAEVVVADADSWFIDYGNPDWKAKTLGCISEMDMVPENTRNEYVYTVDWLKSWPCVRNFGMGTKLPVDERFMIEPLSDSTIYMSFYTIAHLLKRYKPEQLTPELFDYVFKGKGDSASLSKATGIPSIELDEIRKSFDYWYPFDWRCSASELIGNHLTFCIFHHTALFPEEMWPRGMVAFGMGLLEGAKMSSSKGNVVLLKTALEKYGADVVRLFLMSNAEPWQDFDWRDKEVVGAQKALQRFWSVIEDSSKFKEEETTSIDKWLASSWEETKNQVIDSLENFQTRKALQKGFFEVFNLLRWYERRGGRNAKVLKPMLMEWVKLMAPITPHICEEVWEKLGGEGFVSEAEYPQPEDSKIDSLAESGERLLDSVVADVQKIVEMTKTAPKSCSLYVAEDWKYELFEMIKCGAQIGDVMKDDKFRSHGKDIVNLFKKSKEVELPKGWAKETEISSLEDAADFLSKTLDCSVKINPKEDPQNKARFALPMRPAIYLE
jgi:leucyl-tRNA synthetase